MLVEEEGGDQPDAGRDVAPAGDLQSLLWNSACAPDYVTLGRTRPLTLCGPDELLRLPVGSSRVRFST